MVLQNVDAHNLSVNSGADNFRQKYRSVGVDSSQFQWQYVCKQEQFLGGFPSVSTLY